MIDQSFDTLFHFDEAEGIVVKHQKLQGDVFLH